MEGRSEPVTIRCYCAIPVWPEMISEAELLRKVDGKRMNTIRSLHSQAPLIEESRGHRNFLSFVSEEAKSEWIALSRQRNGLEESI